MGSASQCSASSMSRHPGGSTEHTRSARKSRRPGSVRSASDASHGSDGTHACTASEKGAVGMSCSMRSTSVSVTYDVT